MIGALFYDPYSEVLWYTTDGRLRVKAVQQKITLVLPFSAVILLETAEKLSFSLAIINVQIHFLIWINRVRLSTETEAKSPLWHCFHDGIFSIALSLVANSIRVKQITK